MTTLGIDFGTTKTMAAWVNPKTGHHEVINLGEEHNYIPTTVFLDKGGILHFGDEADDLASDAPGRYVRDFKMKLGSGAPALMCFQEGRPCTRTARQLTASFLKHVKQLCEERACFCTVDAAVITRPVNFSPAQVEDLRIAAEEAGFREVTFVTEPEAVGYAFCRLSPDQAFQHSALIVDWGGGTLDMAVVERTGDKVQTDRTRTAGENMMGGEMFDAYLWQYVSSFLREKGADLAMQPHTVLQAAKAQVRRAKEALSKREEKELHLATANGVAPPLLIHRVDFETLIRNDVQRAADTALKLIRGEQSTTKPEMLLLVGGTSLIPLVRSQMERQVGLPARQWQYTREAVAIGAALWLHQDAPAPIESTDRAAIGEQVADSASAQAIQPSTAGSTYKKKAEECMRKYPPDYRAAAEWYAKGHDAGDLNCTYQLAECMLGGLGVPILYGAAMELAEYLEARNCPIGSCLMGEMFSKGQGVPLDVVRGKTCYAKALKKCEKPLPGIDDDTRYEVLFLAASDLNLHEEAAHWAHMRAQVDGSLWSYSMEARSSIYDIDKLTPQEIDRLKQLLKEGIQAGDPGAMRAKTMLMGEDGLFPDDKKERIRLLRDSADIFPIPSVLLSLAILTGDEAVIKQMWETAHLGISRIPAEDELGCVISVHSNFFGAAMRVYERNVAAKLIDGQRIDEIIASPLSPKIVVHNPNNFAIPAFSLRVCIPEQNYDQTFPIAQTIKPGEQANILFEDYDIPLGDRMILEVSSNGKHSRIDYGDLEVLSVPDFINLDGNAPLLVMAWEKGFFGGYKIIINNMGNEEVTGVHIRKQSGAKSNATVSLKPGESISWGWCDFSDSNGLAENETFFLVSDGHLPIAGQIHTTKDDNNSAGIGSIAKLGGAFLLGALGAS
ncbi:MAG: Hsp70 family protein [Akkermansia sp.]|nr:Hsp70 family protein [Akkermansia sp.]